MVRVSNPWVVIRGKASREVHAIGRATTLDSKVLVSRVREVAVARVVGREVSNQVNPTSNNHSRVSRVRGVVREGKVIWFR